MVKINTLFKFGAAVLCVVLLSSCGWLWRSVFRACEPASVQVPSGTINGTYDTAVPMPGSSSGPRSNAPPAAAARSATASRSGACRYSVTELLSLSFF